MNPVNDLKNSLLFRCLAITIACLSLMAFAVRSTTGAAYGLQLSATDDGGEAIIKAKRALKTVKSFRLRMEYYCVDQHWTEVIAVARSGRSHTIEQDSEMITIGGDVYVRTGNRPWKKLPSRSKERASDYTQFPEDGHTESEIRYKDVKFIGRDILANVPVLVYQYTVHTSDKLFSTNKIWIGAQDGLPHRTEAEIEVVYMWPTGGPGKLKMIMSYYDFNAEIVIEPPTVQTTEAAAEAKPQPIDEKKRQVVQQAAEAWLKLMDEGKSSAAWEATAQCYKAQVSKESWERLQRYLSEPAKERGPIKSRKLQTATFVKSLPSICHQEGIVLVYDIVLEKSGSGSEEVELVFEPDQGWRVAMYRALTSSISVEPRRSSGSGSGGGISTGMGAGPGDRSIRGGGDPRPGGAASSAQGAATDAVRESLLKAVRAFQAIKSFRVRTESYDTNNRSTLVTEFVRPDRSRVLTENYEAVIIGGNAYYRQAGELWSKLPDGQGRQPKALRLPETEISEVLKRSKEVKLIGPDTLNNVPVLVYQYSERRFSTTRIWIGAQDGLPHRIETEVDDFSQRAVGPGHQRTIITLYDFNADIVIEPPTRLAPEKAATAPPRMLDEKQRQMVQQAAEAWLKLMDEGKASASWEAAAQGLKEKISKESWERHQRYFVEQAKEQWTIKSRKLGKATFVKSLPSTHAQEGIVLEYESTLEKSGPVTESVELVLEYDQVWRVAMYKVTSAEPGVPASSGPGGGIGTGKGGGIGSGDGTGLGPGHGFNTGGGNPRPDPNAPATSVDQKPIVLTSSLPRYTEEARKNKIQGTVWVRVLVGADGAVKQVRMVRGLPDGLEDEAIRAAYKMRFRPAMKGGQPVAFWVLITMEFDLRDSRQ